MSCSCDANERLVSAVTNNLWELVELARRDRARFQEVVDRMAQKGLSRFIWDHSVAEDDLHQVGLRAHMGTAATDETVSQLAEWIVDQGIDEYDQIVEDISKAPRMISANPNEGLRRIAERSYRRRFRNAAQLSGTRLWDVVELGRKDPRKLEQRLRRMKEADLVEIYWAYGRAMQYLYQAGLRDHMGDAGSDYALESLAEWIVDQGNEYWNSVLDDLSQAPRRLERGQEGGFRQLISAIYRKRFDSDVPYPGGERG